MATQSIPQGIASHCLDFEDDDVLCSQVECSDCHDVLDPTSITTCFGCDEQFCSRCLEFHLEDSPQCFQAMGAD